MHWEALQQHVFPWEIKNKAKNIEYIMKSNNEWEGSTANVQMPPTCILFMGQKGMTLVDYKNGLGTWSDFNFNFNSFILRYRPI